MEDQEMGFWDHLEALRWTLMRCAIVIAVCMIGCFIALPHIFDDFVLGPTTSRFFVYRWLDSLSALNGVIPDFGNESFHVEIINIDVVSQFMTHITCSFWLALVLAFPLIIHQFWRFISPALYPSEQKNVGIAFVFGTVMFYLGCAVGYCLVFPFMFHFLADYQLSQTIVNQISLDSYMGNFLMMIFIMGIVFELPLLAWLLSKFGIVTKDIFTKFRRHAVVALLILSAIITPTGDPISLLIVFVPLYLLYELSILVVRPASAD